MQPYLDKQDTFLTHLPSPYRIKISYNPFVILENRGRKNTYNIYCNNLTYNYIFRGCMQKNNNNIELFKLFMAIWSYIYFKTSNISINISWGGYKPWSIYLGGEGVITHENLVGETIAEYLIWLETTTLTIYTMIFFHLWYPSNLIFLLSM